MNKRTFSVLSLLVVLSMLLGAPVAFAQVDSPGPGAPDKLPPELHGATGPQHVMVELYDTPAAQVWAEAQGDVQAQSAQQQLSRIESAQKPLQASLTGLGAQIMYSVQRVYNGIAITVDASKLQEIAQLPGVKAVHPMTPKTIDNSSSVPLIGAPQVWAAAAAHAQGQGVKIGIIDTGIDYLHADFGGGGGENPALYTQNNTTIVGDVPGYPSAKVAGGWDLVGDNYNANVLANSTPHPDPDPMDCNGHGSHVAGTAAGYGVNPDGTTYRGSYDGLAALSSSAYLSKFRIGPGVAPLATLYAIRVFGCTGSTLVTTQAIEWAMDPNQDGNFSDHMDVINMSLGSPYGVSYDESAVASNIAALTGMIVVASAGNNGDSYYVTGSPATGDRLISVASSVDALDVMDSFKVEKPAAIAGYYGASRSVAFNWNAMTQPVSGTAYYPPTNRTGCTPFSADELTNISGKVLLLDWTMPGTPGYCGSVARGARARAAGAIAAILIDPNVLLSTAITGDTAIPMMITTKGVGDILKAHLNDAGGEVISFFKDYPLVNVSTPGAVDTLSSFSSRGPRGMDNALKPDLAAPGQSIWSVSSGSGNQGESLNGTSMAAPHVTGAMALLRQLHPDWSNMELKALAMNTANHDIRSDLPMTATLENTGRVGAGRVDVFQASQSSVIAFNADRPELVSVSFGQVEVLNSATAVKHVRIQNKGAAAQTYAVSYRANLAEPGVSVAVSPSTVNVPAGGTANVDVTMTATAAQMKHTIDPTVSKAGGRHWLSDFGGLVLFTPGQGANVPALRVPVYGAARPASDMHAANHMLRFGVSPNITLAGTGVQTGPNVPVDEQSLVMPFELQTIHPTDVTLGRPWNALAMKYAGVTANFRPTQQVVSSTVFFGLSTYGQWATPNEVEFDINIDTGGSSAPEYVLFNWNLNWATGQQDPNDVFIAVLGRYNPNGTVSLIAYYPINLLSAAQANTVPFNTDSMMMPVGAADLGLTQASSVFTYTVTSFRLDSDAAVAVDQTAPRRYDVANPGLEFTGGANAVVPGMPAYLDMPGVNIPVVYHASEYALNQSRGILLLHTHNQAGKHGEAVFFGQTAAYLPWISKK